MVLPLGLALPVRGRGLPSLLVAAVRRRLKEPEVWRKVREAGGDELRSQLGSVGELFRVPRWRRHTLVGLTLAISGVIGLWGIGFWSPELIREALADVSAETRSWYVSMGTLLQDVGAFGGIFVFTLLTARWAKARLRGAFLLLALRHRLALWLAGSPAQVLWMFPWLVSATDGIRRLLHILPGLPPTAQHRGGF